MRIHTPDLELQNSDCGRVIHIIACKGNLEVLSYCLFVHLNGKALGMHNFIYKIFFFKWYYKNFNSADYKYINKIKVFFT